MLLLLRGISLCSPAGLFLLLMVSFLLVYILSSFNLWWALVVYVVLLSLLPLGLISCIFCTFGRCLQRLPGNDSIRAEREHLASVQHMFLVFLTLCIMLLFWPVGRRILWSCFMFVCMCVCVCALMLCSSWHGAKFLRSSHEGKSWRRYSETWYINYQIQNSSHCSATKPLWCEQQVGKQTPSSLGSKTDQSINFSFIK